jgi:hypothetical protein
MKTLLSAIAILVSGAAYADPGSGEYDLCMQAPDCRTATNAELDQLRGGFHLVTRGGRLRIDIGITRAVTVNDRLVAVSHLVIPSASAPGVASEQALVVQNGPGNVAPSAAAFGNSAIPLIVQNTLDDQRLKTFTVINASVNSLSLMRSLRMDEMMRRATAASGR